MGLKSVLAGAAALFVAGSGSAAAAPIVSNTFDAGTEGWTAVGDVASFTHQAAGGNPGGHIQVNDAASGPVIFFVAPNTYHGDFSAAFRGTLSFDLNVSSSGSYFADNDVLITGGGVTIALDIADPARDAWTSYSFDLDDSAAWKVNTVGGVDATNAQIQAVLANVTDLQIRAEYIVGADIGRLDNVEITAGVPVPAGAVLMISGLALAAGARRFLA